MCVSVCATVAAAGGSTDTNDIAVTMLVHNFIFLSSAWKIELNVSFH